MKTFSIWIWVMLASPCLLAQEIEWSLAEVTQEAAREIQKIYDNGGESAVIDTIISCHSKLVGSAYFNAATAKCYAIDMTGSIILSKKAMMENTKLHPFVKEKGNFVIRGAGYFSQMDRAEAENAMYIIQKNIALALPELDKK